MNTTLKKSIAARNDFKFFHNIDDLLADSTAKIIDYINQRKKDTRTALHLAVATGDSEITNFLLRNGADATVLVGDGSSALHLAAAAGNDHLISLLLAEGLQVDMRDNQHWTALHR